MSGPVLVGISGGVGSSRRTTALVGRVLAAARELDGDLELHLIDLQEQRLPLCDGTPPDRLKGPSREVAERLLGAAGFVIGTPVYRASFSAVLKNLLDMAPADALADRPATIAVTGGSRDHFLVGDYALRPVLAAMGADTQATAIYADPSAAEGELAGRLEQTIAAAAAELVGAIRARKTRSPDGA